MPKTTSKPTSTTISTASPLLFAAAVAATTLALVGSARAGVTIVTQRGSDPPATISLDGEHARIDNPQRVQRETAIIIDAGAKRIVILNDTDKSYSEMTEADMKRMRERLDVMKAQMAERLKGMPPEQRKKIEDMMAGMGAAPGGKPAKPHEYKFEKMGEKKSINGFSCEMYRVLEDGKPHEEDCISPWSAGLLQKGDLEPLRKFGEQMSKELTGDMNGPAGERDIFAHLDKYPGIPVSRVPLEAGGARGPEEQIKSVKRGAVSASKFAVPAGYTKKENPVMGGPGGQRPGGPYRQLPPPQQ